MCCRVHPCCGLTASHLHCVLPRARSLTAGAHAAAKAPLSRSQGRAQVRSHAQKYFLGLSKAAKLKPGARDSQTTASVESESAGGDMEVETVTEGSQKRSAVEAAAATDATTVVAATVAAANPGTAGAPPSVFGDSKPDRVCIA